jgi:hypothetical protein
MPVDDLLRFIGGPLPFSQWWLFAGLFVFIFVVAWYGMVFVWTLPPSVLRRIPLIRSFHAEVNRRRFVRAIRNIDAQYRGGGLGPAQACAALSRTVRSFLYVSTGIKAQYIHVEQLADGPLGAAVPVLKDLNDVRFNPGTRTEVGTLVRSARELVSSWT